MLDVLVLKNLLGLDAVDTSNDAALQFALDDAEEIILNYCNISKMPKGLEKTMYRMAMDLYRNEQPGTAKGSTSGSVSSIEEGDTTVSFNTNSYDEAFASSLLKMYSKSLNRYRKVAW